MLNSLRNLADIAAFNIGFNISTQYRPVAFFGNQLMDFVNPETTCKKIVVILTNQFRSNDLKDIKEAPILEHSLNIFPSFKKVYSPQFLCPIIIALQV